MRVAAISALLLVTAGCAGSVQGSTGPVAKSPAAASPSPVPTRDPSRDSMPLVADVMARGSLHSFEGGDDHITFGIQNRGRDVQALVIDAGPWLQEHDIAMFTTNSCNFETDPDLIVCGPVYSGEGMSVVVHAFPLHAGTFHYEVRFFSRENGHLSPILDASGRQSVIGVDELVDPQGRQVQGYVPTPSPTP